MKSGKIGVMKRKLKCAKCGKEKLFWDTKDILNMKWKILAWQLHLKGEPLVYCPSCKYQSIGLRGKNNI